MVPRYWPKDRTPCWYSTERAANGCNGKKAAILLLPWVRGYNRQRHAERSRFDYRLADGAGALGPRSGLRRLESRRIAASRGPVRFRRPASPPTVFVGHTLWPLVAALAVSACSRTDLLLGILFVAVSDQGPDRPGRHPSRSRLS